MVVFDHVHVVGNFRLGWGRGVGLMVTPMSEERKDRERSKVKAELSGLYPFAAFLDAYLEEKECDLSRLIPLFLLA